MGKKLIGVILVWTLGLGLLFYWNIQSALSHREELILRSARVLFEEMVIVRQWNSEYNGVYVRVDRGAESNPYLKDELRDLDCNGIRLTKFNPSYMTREISDKTNRQFGVRFHVTGLAPLRPENRPDSWEKSALESFSRDGILEKGEFLKNGKAPYFKYIKGLVAEDSCLECHKEKGVGLNDIVGGISVSLYNLPSAKLAPVIAGHLIIWIAGLLMIYIAGMKLIRAYRTIYDQSILDGLTGIPNRRCFDERLTIEGGRSLRTKTPLSVIMADIDNFKAYNDSYGHARGDEVLKAVAKSIRRGLARPTDFCARYGGEEFVVILPETRQSGAEHVAAKIRERVEDLDIPHEYSDAAPRVTLSLGIAVQAGAEDPMELVKAADHALYQAKSEGKNRYASNADG